MLEGCASSKKLRALRAQPVRLSDAYLIRVVVAASTDAATPLHDQNLWMMPTPAANWLRDEDGAPFWPSPISAVALMMLVPFVPRV